MYLISELNTIFVSPAIFLVTIKKGGEKWKRPPIVLQLGDRGELRKAPTNQHVQFFLGNGPTS